MDEAKWVEAQGKTVEIATRAALEELGIESEDRAEVQVLQEPRRGFLGRGSKEAIVRVTVRPRRARRRRGGRGRSRGQGRRQGGSGRSPQKRNQTQKPNRNDKPKHKNGSTREKPPMAESKTEAKELPPVDHERQAEIIREFLTGLVTSFGLEGEVHVRVEDDIIYANVEGEQTEALVGVKGAILQSIHELCRTVVQRKSFHTARIRLDIAGYAERRREALKIYAGRLAERVLAEGGEIELEPMNPADRKVVHDAAAEIEGVRSFSEGEEPRRRVILSVAPGYGPSAASSPAEAATEDE